MNKMSLSEFKTIFYTEYFHRLIGRLIFLVMIIPLIVFWYMRLLSKCQAMKLLSIFSLVGFQGLIGWIMVSSGLKDRTSVQPFWLAFHLCFALLIFSLVLWQALAISPKQKLKETYSPSIKILLFITTFIIMPIQIFLGGLVAGDHIIGFCAENNHILCSKNPFSIILPSSDAKQMLIFYIHRMSAVVLTYLILYIISYNIYKKRLYKATLSLVIWIFIQIFLGMKATLDINSVAIPALHQLNAFIIMGIMIYLYKQIDNKTCEIKN